MQAIVIAIGDEMTSGQRVDTNSAWISAELLGLGVPTVMHITAGDDIGMCADAIRFAMQQAELVIITGGLGPTADDITRDAVATATDRKLELDPAALAHVESIFSRRGREMPARNRVQAMFPVGASMVPNPHGTAPGLDLTARLDSKRETRLIALPGVPAEAKEMWTATVGPSLSASSTASSVIRTYLIKCFGDGESAIERRLGALTSRDRNPLVGITVHQATITLRITASATTAAECDALAEQTQAAIRGELGDLVFGEGDDELEDAVLRALAECNGSLATLECDRQALLCRWLQAAELRHGDPDLYRGGLVCCDPEHLANLLDVESHETVADLTTATACQTAAEALRKSARVSHALVLGAVASTSDGRAEAADVPLAVATTQGTKCLTIPYSGHPDVRGPRLVKGALEQFRRALMSE